MTTTLVDEGLTYRIIGAAIEVHRVLGSGFLESVYEEALCYELDRKSLPYERQTSLDIRYKDLVFLNRFRADIIVDSRIIVEVKAIQRLTVIEDAQLLNYLRVTGMRVGLLFNFGASRLDFRRRVH